MQNTDCHSLAYLKHAQYTKPLGTQSTVEYWLFTLAYLPGSCNSPLCPDFPGSLGKEQNSECEVWFLLNAYHFCTILKSKSLKLNHPKLGAVYQHIL